MAEIVNYSPSMDMTNKLQQALDCLLKENFTIQDKTLLEKLLTSLHNEGKWLKKENNFFTKYIFIILYTYLM